MPFTQQKCFTALGAAPSVRFRRIGHIRTNAKNLSLETPGNTVRSVTSNQPVRVRVRSGTTHHGAFRVIQDRVLASALRLIFPAGPTRCAKKPQPRSVSEARTAHGVCRLLCHDYNSLTRRITRIRVIPSNLAACDLLPSDNSSARLTSRISMDWSNSSNSIVACSILGLVRSSSHQ